MKLDILKGVKVIDLTSYAAGPAASRLFADWGAEVIKVEPPQGDAMRFFGATIATPIDEEENPVWQIENANKRGIALDLKKPEGREVLYKLFETADAFVTNTRIEALRKLGLDYESLEARFPHLVWGHMSGYGLYGEESARPGFDVVSYWARGGTLTGVAPEGGPPITTPIGMGDHTSSLVLAAGVLAAIIKKKLTGKGEKVSTSLFGSAIWTGALMITSCQEGYGDKYPKSRYEPLTPLSNSYQCKDGEWITLTILEYNRYFAPFCKVMGCEELINDERYNNVHNAKQHTEEVCKILEAAFLKKDRAEWAKELAAADMAYETCRHYKDVTKDPQAWANNYLINYTFPNGNTAVLPATPVQFKENVVPTCKSAPKLGEHSAEILAEVGYDKDSIKRMLDEKIVISK